MIGFMKTKDQSTMMMIRMQLWKVFYWMLPQLGEESLQRRGKSTSLNKRKNLHAGIIRKGLLVDDLMYSENPRRNAII